MVQKWIPSALRYHCLEDVSQRVATRAVGSSYLVVKWWAARSVRNYSRFEFCIGWYVEGLNPSRILASLWELNILLQNMAK